MSELSSQLEGKATSGADPVAISSAASTVIGPVDVQVYDRFTVYVKNMGGGGANDITSVMLQTAPTEDGPWMDVEDGEVLDADLSSGEATYNAFNDASIKFLRVRASCDGGNTTTGMFWLSVGGQD